MSIHRELETLAGYSDAPPPAVTRVVFSAMDLRARAYVKSLCVDAGLQVREDAVGNTFARWQGTEPDLPAVATGSHTDAIPHSGRYDGTVGVLGGLDAIRTLQRSGFRPRRSIELIIFTSEEPTRFGIGCLGSRLLSGAISQAADEALHDAEEHSLRQVREEAGFYGSLASVRLAAGHYAGFIELHIEQGPLLEQRGVPIGIVTAIAAPASLALTITGDGGHAGAVLMPVRHDAFCAAAEIALALEAAAKSTGAVDTVATTGACKVFPGAVNSIPSCVSLGIDVRDTDARRRDSVLDSLTRTTEDVARHRGVQIETEVLNRDEPALCDQSIVDALTAAARKSGLPFDLMVSRAYHDSLFMSRICPTAMLFVPCRNGWSHRPDEYASPEAIDRGVQILADTLAATSST